MLFLPPKMSLSTSVFFGFSGDGCWIFGFSGEIFVGNGSACIWVLNYGSERMRILLGYLLSTRKVWCGIVVG